MYKPKIYTVKDKNIIKAFIEKYPLALITTSNSSGKSVATQVPLIFDKSKKQLQGHIMKHTSHHKAFTENSQVLVIFTGPNAYISGSWYNKPHVASTWNYMSVQIQGKISFMSEKELDELMKTFTLKFEDGNLNSPTIYENIPNDYLKQYMQAITGFVIHIDSIEAIFKLSQDKDEESFYNIIKQLKQKSFLEQHLAEEMLKLNH